MSRLLACTAAAATVAGLTMLGAPAGATSAGRELDLRFEAGAARSNAGATAVTVRTLTAHGGSAENVAGPGGGTAVRLPAFAADDPPLAVLSVVDEEGEDDLSPGSSRFRFGADFALDAASQGSSVDNGNNLVQRGSYRAAMQYKLEVDGRRPGCRVKGTSGAVTVRSSRQVSPGRWYHASCLRSGTTVTLRVVDLAAGTTWTYQRSGSIGAVQAARRSVPLSVGGKLNDRGAIAVSSSDQFNGRVDNAFLNVLG